MKSTATVDVGLKDRTGCGDDCQHFHIGSSDEKSDAERTSSEDSDDLKEALSVHKCVEPADCDVSAITEAEEAKPSVPPK